MERAHRDGELRPELEAIDVLVVLRMLGTVVGHPAVDEPQARGCVDVVLREMQPDAPPAAFAGGGVGDRAELAR